MTNNPELALQKVKILLDLEKIPGKKTILGVCIINAVRKKLKADDIINFVKQQYWNNPTLTVQVIGEDLASRICEI